MTDRPYTDEDLRLEAARIHRRFTAEPDEGIVGEVMESGYVPSAETTEDGSARTWPELLEPHGEETPEYQAAQRSVTDLVRGAADISEWAITLGADQLDPSHHALTLGTDEKPIARIHFAFEPDMPDEERTALIHGLGQVIANSM